MPDGLSQAEQELINAAVSAGKVQVIPQGLSSYPPVVWDESQKKLVSTDPEYALRLYRGTGGQHRSRIKDARLKKIPSLVKNGKSPNDLARIFNVQRETINKDLRELGLAGADGSVDFQAMSFERKRRETRSAIMAAYSPDKTYGQIASESGYAHKTVQKYILDAGLAAKTGRSGPPVSKAVLARRDAVRAMVAEGKLSGPQMAEKLGCGVGTFYRDIKSLGLKIARVRNSK